MATRRQRIAKRRRRRVARADNDLTDAEWSSLLTSWGGCAYCGTETDALQRDCVLPISRGGRYTFDNVVPACRSCNASKCNSEVTGWMRRKRLDERTFLVRHHEIVSARTAIDPGDAELTERDADGAPAPTRSR